MLFVCSCLTTCVFQPDRGAKRPREEDGDTLRAKIKSSREARLHQSIPDPDAEDLDTDRDSILEKLLDREEDTEVRFVLLFCFNNDVNRICFCKLS